MFILALLFLFWFPKPSAVRPPAFRLPYLQYGGGRRFKNIPKTPVCIYFNQSAIGEWCFWGLCLARRSRNPTPENGQKHANLPPPPTRKPRKTRHGRPMKSPEPIFHREAFSLGHAKHTPPKTPCYGRRLVEMDTNWCVLDILKPETAGILA
jgi:hypothetical protein